MKYIECLGPLRSFDPPDAFARNGGASSRLDLCLESGDEMTDVDW